MTIYVSRLQGKAINGLFACPQYPGQEAMQDNDPEAAAFLAGLPVPDGGAALVARLVAVEKQLAAVVLVPAVAAGLKA